VVRRVLPLLLIAAALLVAATAAGARPLKSCNGSKSLCSRHFDHVVLPATHNSMSAQSLGWHLPNQPVPIDTQLEDGIRGLLIDTHYGERRDDGVIVTDDDRVKSVGPRDMYLCHEYCEIGASLLVPQLHKIAGFLKAHPDNVLLLDIEDYITPEGTARAMKESGLSHYLYKGKPGPKWPTLQSMIKQHQQVVVLAEHDAGDGAYPWYNLDYDGIVQETPYTWTQQDQLTEPSNWHASCVANRGGTTGSLFLMNHWFPSTPQEHPDKMNYDEVNAKSVLVGRAKECASSRKLLPTIVAVDQYRYGDDGGLFAAVKRLNQLEK
jgi:hypothetical protein